MGQRLRDFGILIRGGGGGGCCINDRSDDGRVEGPESSYREPMAYVSRKSTLQLDDSIRRRRSSDF